MAADDAAADEAALGIAAFAGPPRAGFDAVVKHRYEEGDGEKRGGVVPRFFFFPRPT